MSEGLDSVFKLALGAVWTAGYRPTMDEKYALRRACGYFDHRKMNAHLGEFTAAGKGSGFDGMRDYFQVEAIRALSESGYPLAETPARLDLVQPLPLPARSDVPQAGDIVRSAKPWSGCSEFGLQGALGVELPGFTIANRRGGWYVGTDPDRPNYASMGNGGPSSCGRLDARVLIATAEIDRLFCWAFAFTPEAHTGVEFYLPVRVWDWSGEWVEEPEAATERESVA